MLFRSDYLGALQWDGVPRVERMLVELFGAADNAYSLRAAQCFMVSAVARILWVDAKQPSVGAQVDFMLVLEGEQGKRKSSALRAIFGSEWFVETSESPSGKDFYQVITALHPVAIRVLQPRRQLVGIRVDELVPAATCPWWISVQLHLVAGVVEPPQPLQPIVVLHDQNQVVQRAFDIPIAISG